MKKLYLFLSMLALNSQLQAKQVDVATAKLAGFHFLTGKLSSEVLHKADDLQLVYTAASSTQPENYYYVFNAGNAGFVMVSADDIIVPVFGYSNEGAIDISNLAPATDYWFKTYENQIRHAIENKAVATGETTAQWKSLLTGPANGANKTTTVSPLVKTKWNQAPYENLLCPSNGSGRAVTGCVATSMSQIMKFWNYPTQGLGTHSYFATDFGMQTVNFGTTTYNWSAMPNSLNSGTSASAKTAVATLMYHAGVSVEMIYGVNSSGAQVIQAWGGTASSEYALVNFFGYDAGISSVERNNISSETAWKAILKKDLDAGRPVLYVGFSPSGGHAWVCDGYDASDYFHMNWGWGGMSDGNFLVSDLDPSSLGTGGGTGGGFDNNQQLLYNIQPPVIAADAFESNNTTAEAKKVTTPAINNHTGTTSLSASFHTTSDEDYYEIVTPNTNHQYRVSARMQDKKYANNSKTYTVDAKFAASTSKTTLSSFIDTVLSKGINAAGNTSVYFRVVPFALGTRGTYQLDITITDVTTGISETAVAADINVFPNPASGVLYVALDGAKASEVSLTDIQGRIIRKVAVGNEASVEMNLNGIASGTYFVRIATETVVVTKKISIN